MTSEQLLFFLVLLAIPLLQRLVAAMRGRGDAARPPAAEAAAAERVAAWQPVESADDGRARFSQQVTRAEVHLSDENGQRGGDNYALMGRTADAHRIFEGLLAVQKDMGLMAEEYDPVARRHLGNFPQAFSHLGLINTARNLTQSDKPAVVRQRA